MMKRSFFTVLFALICTLGFSQVSFNVKAGLNLSSYIGENSDNSKFKPGVRLGVGMEYQFNEMVAHYSSLRKEPSIQVIIKATLQMPMQT